MINVFLNEDLMVKESDQFFNYKDYAVSRGIEVINTCTLCQVNILPNLIGEVYTRKYVYVLMECPNCEEIFIAKYSTVIQQNSSLQYTLKSMFPVNLKEFVISDRIAEFSQSFVKIYNQALTAENYGLDEIAGIGYRKALEFLIKDYLKKNNPEDAENIEKEQLAKCINTIDNVNIKKMAKGATWIGNDETHYIKKWENKDINDLKNMINLTLTWIQLEIQTIEYTEEMNL